MGKGFSYSGSYIPQPGDKLERRYLSMLLYFIYRRATLKKSPLLPEILSGSHTAQSTCREFG
jgi:hypothetical protein